MASETSAVRIARYITQPASEIMNRPLNPDPNTLPAFAPGFSLAFRFAFKIVAPKL